MDQEEFARRFFAALDATAEEADMTLGRSVPRAFRILLHGAGHPGELMSSEAALAELYLGPERSYRIIDFGVVEVSPSFTTIFVRASAHHPAGYQRTWNQPPLYGPFKLVTAQNVRILDQ